MSRARKNKWMNSAPYRLNDNQFMEQSDYIINNALKGRGSSAEISEVFIQGYPIEKLRLLFESNNTGVLYNAIETCYEIGQLAKCYVNDVAEIMDKNPLLKIGEGIVWLADYAEEINSLADWMIVSFVDEDHINDIIIGLKILSGISLEQLRGAKTYLLEHIPDSHHVNAIDFYLNHYQNENEILEMMKRSDVLMQRYAVAMASRYFYKNSSLRDEAFKIRDEAIRTFVQEQFHKINFSP